MFRHLRQSAPALLARVLLVGSILLFGSLQGNAAELSQRPNILFILSDDLGVNDIGSWGDGKARTPTIDQLSRQSIRFRQHYTDSTCSVSRAALITGRAPVSIGFEPDGLGLSPDLVTLPKALAQLGYSTHHLGKWHLGEALEYPQIRPNHQGFDDWYGMLNHFVLQGPDAQGRLVARRPTYINPWLQQNDEAPRQVQGHLDDLLTARAVELIRAGATEQKPWFINLWLLAPHTPIQPSETFRKRWPDTPEGNYLALLEQLDHNVGRVLDALRESGQAERTIVVFSSDNGSPNHNRDSNYPLSGTKATYLEGGVRTPLMIFWPGHHNDRDIDSVTHITDIYPTLLGMAGGHPVAGLTGRDLSAPLAKERPLPPFKDLYWGADLMQFGMIYAGHVPGQGLFYRDIYGKVLNAPVSGPVGQGPLVQSGMPAFTAEQASARIRDWERRVRPVPLDWHPPSAASAGYLSGRDFQRAPVFDSYSLGLGLGKAPGDKRQVLVEQDGVWRLWLEQGRLHMRHGEVQVDSEPLALERSCNALVASFTINPPSGFPFPGPGASRFTLYLNGKAVMHSEQVLSRPDSAAPLANPTYVGGDGKGGARFAGRIGRPVLVDKFLLPQQEGYSLADMQSTLCPKR